MKIAIFQLIFEISVQNENHFLLECFSFIAFSIFIPLVHILAQTMSFDPE